MSKTDWLKPLEQILNCPMRISITNEEQWIELLQDDKSDMKSA